MDRKQILDTLSVVRPALATSDLIRVLTHLWFTGRDVLAYNDQIAISTPCETEFAGAVPGGTLLSLLSASRAKTVELAQADEELRVKAAGARFRVPLLPPDAFVFEMPADVEGAVVPLGASDLVAAIKACLRSVSADTSTPDQLGVTLIPSKKAIAAYSTNGATISHVDVKLQGKCPLTRRVVLPGPLCEQIVRLAAGDKKADLVVADDHALLRLSSGARVYGKLVEVDRPLDFEGVIGSIVPEDLADASVLVPPAIKLAVERALVVADPSGERAVTRVRVREGVATLVTKSARGEVQDRLRLRGHVDVDATVDVQWLRVGVAAGFDHILVTEQAVVMTGTSGLYMVATSR